MALVPGHEGLIAPLWRRWPQYFDAVGLFVGAGMPDLADGAVGIVRGHLGQSYGHTLLGLFLICTPVGVLIAYAAYACTPPLERVWPGLIRFLRRLGPPPAVTAAPGPSRFPRLGFMVWAVWLGTVSHLVIDFFSHDNFILFRPWYESDNFFPAWWYLNWYPIHLPLYKNPFHLGPPLLIWIGLSILGLYMLFRPLWRKSR